jgi:pimeloyl-ACP methyl ester carboxylesterase
MEVERSDGRRLRVEVAGDGDRVIVAQLGTPNAGVLYDGWVEDAAVRGLRLITYDRPGYGGSTPLPGRTVADCAADVRAISDAVGFDRCAVWGFSGGGPHALACGALLGDLVAAVATIGSPAPIDAPGLDYLDRMGDGAREDVELFRSDRAAWDRLGDRQREEMLALNVDDLREAFGAGKSPTDRRVLSGPFGAWLHGAVHAALEAGNDGWMGDGIALYMPWGFDPADIRVPVTVWHGEDDRFVPVGHGRWLAEAIPGAEAEIHDGDGHLGVACEGIGAVHDWLAARVVA